jgi:hypothetical protein
MAIRWLRSVTGARAAMEHFRVSSTLATISIGLDWVRFAPPGLKTERREAESQR